jgi:NAD(P)H-dependent flavin oxidoreductase YrpB (nitropropane dioxygenase family)
MMILIGHPWIKSPEFCRIFSQDDIKASRADQIVLLEPLVDSHKLAQYCQENSITYAVVVNTLDEALYANALGAAYMICYEDTALMVQPVAQEYLFDTRVLVLIHSEKEISKIARGGVDGVIFAEAIC